MQISDLDKSEPTLNYSIDMLRMINKSKHCSVAPTLSIISAVLLLFSIGDLAVHNCTGRSSTGAEDKHPLHKIKLKSIKECVFF